MLSFSLSSLPWASLGAECWGQDESSVFDRTDSDDPESYFLTRPLFALKYLDWGIKT